MQHEETIKRLTEELTNGSRSLDSFLSSISHCVVSFDYSLYCLLHIFVGENCCMLAHLDILGTCTEILDILALDILDLDILGLILQNDPYLPKNNVRFVNDMATWPQIHSVRAFGKCYKNGSELLRLWL